MLKFQIFHDYKVNVLFLKICQPYVYHYVYHYISQIKINQNSS